MQNKTEISRQLVNTLHQCLGYNNSTHDVSVNNLNVLISKQILKAPYYIYLGMTVLIHLFNLLPLMKWGKTFCFLTKDRQNAYTLNWKVSRISSKRDFINFYESFIILGIHDKSATTHENKKH